MKYKKKISVWHDNIFLKYYRCKNNNNNGCLFGSQEWMKTIKCQLVKANGQKDNYYYIYK